MSIVIAILILGFIIFVHEGGHFIVAKFFKVPVREFSIGMGPRILSKVIHNTRYSLKAFPFGGSCAMIGEDPAGSGDFTEEEDVVVDDEKGTITFDGVTFTKEEIDKNNFSVISPLKKFFICLAGPFMNFVLAFIFALFIVSKVGFDIPYISAVSPNSAASSATPFEIIAGDKIVGLEIPNAVEKVYSYRDIALFLQLNNEAIMKYNYPLIITIERKNDDKIETVKTVVYPKVDENTNRVVIGLSFENVYKKANNVVEIVKYAYDELNFYVRTTIMSLRMLIKGQLKMSDVSGPVGTVAVMGTAIDEANGVNIESAIYTIFMLIVLISSNLGVMNLLPIPALDGGRIVFAVIEMIIGRPINKKVEASFNAVTMILLLLFMLWIFGLDIYKLIAVN